MKKNLKNKLKIILLINICCVSLLYYVYSIQVKDFANKNEKFEVDEYKFEIIYLLGTLSEEVYVKSFENSRMIEITEFLEALLNRQEDIFFTFFFNATYLSYGFFLIFKNTLLNKKTSESTSLNIEGIELSKIEMKIFNLIQDFLNQNRIFNRERIVPYIKSRYRINGNLNHNGINSVIDSLLKKNLILEGSKLTRKTVLLNSNREKIYNLIKQSPGIYMNKLSIILKLSSFVVKWHLSILLNFNLVRKQNLNNQFSYFNSSLNKKNDLIFQIISRDKCIKIINLLKESKKGYTRIQIGKLLKMHYNTITKYLNKLDKFNLLIKTKMNKITEYIFLNEKNFNKLIRQS